MNIQEAAAEAKKFGNFIRAFEKLSEVAIVVAAHESNIAEREAKLAALNAEIIDKDAYLSFDAKRSEKQAELTALEQAVAAQQLAINVGEKALASAQQQADSTIEQANAMAANLVQSAKTEAKLIQDQAQESVKKSKYSLSVIEGEARAAEAARDKALTEYQEYMRKLEDAKASARAMLG